ncbi:MAG: recombination regulator RecX [Coriobacteriales bacterium]|jgi:regulatory protein|nr:recombination regulator RecX [Coriobacteriales bacterium]
MATAGDWWPEMSLDAQVKAASSQEALVKTISSQEIQIKAAEDKCLRLLACRERSSGELRKRLLSAGIDVEVTEFIINRLVASGVVDDARFCRLYVESKLNQGWGVPRIIHSLAGFGIDAEDYQELLGEYLDASSELARAMDALTHYRGRARDGYTGRNRFLTARGFAPGIIYQALAVWRESEKLSI